MKINAQAVWNKDHRKYVDAVWYWVVLGAYF